MKKTSLSQCSGSKSYSHTTLISMESILRTTFPEEVRDMNADDNVIRKSIILNYIMEIIAVQCIGSDHKKKAFQY